MAVVLGVGQRAVEDDLFARKRYILDVGHAAVVAVEEACYRIRLHTYGCCHAVEAVDYHHAPLTTLGRVGRQGLRIEALATLVYRRYAVAVPTPLLLGYYGRGAIYAPAAVETSVVYARVEDVVVGHRRRF